MASEVDISNLALSNIGEEAEVTAISPPDGSIQAAHCGRYYPIARNLLLEMHPWTFAMTRVSLALVSAPAPSEWAYAYAMPTDCLKDQSVLAVDALDDAAGEDYIIEADADGNAVLYTNMVTATLRYTRAVIDTTKFTPSFVVALGSLLASYLAGPIIKGPTGMAVKAAMLKQFAIEVGIAKTQDSNRGQRSTYANRLSSAQIARGSFPLGRNGNWPL